MSPNVGHLILKYLCPAVRDILSDGLKAYVLDMIIGQRRNIPWSVVEASTQLGKKKTTDKTKKNFLSEERRLSSQVVSVPSSLALHSYRYKAELTNV